MRALGWKILLMGNPELSPNQPFWLVFYDFYIYIIRVLSFIKLFCCVVQTNKLELEDWPSSDSTKSNYRKSNKTRILLTFFCQVSSIYLGFPPTPEIDVVSHSKYLLFREQTIMKSYIRHMTCLCSAAGCSVWVKNCRHYNFKICDIIHTIPKKSN